MKVTEHLILTKPSCQRNGLSSLSERESNGNESRYGIVGMDETNTDRGWVSWLSPIAKALLNARLG